MYLTDKNTGETIEVRADDIMDYQPKEGYTSLLVIQDESYSLNRLVWINVVESISEIDDEMLYGTE
jgi:hypothetical protein